VAPPETKRGRCEKCRKNIENAIKMPKNTEKEMSKDSF
jgi:hypothetical protein